MEAISYEMPLETDLELSEIERAGSVLASVGMNLGVVWSSTRVLRMPSERWEARRKAGLLGEEEASRAKNAERVARSRAEILQALDGIKEAVEIARREAHK